MKKILFIVRGIKADFLCDMVYCGLTQLQDIQVQILLKQGTYSWMFINQTTRQQRWNQWGHGFTVTNIINPNKKRLVSLQQAKQKIRDKYYNQIIYGSIERCNLLQQFIVNNYPKNKIAFINGDDSVWFDWNKDINLKNRILERSQKGVYFKRQLDQFLINYCNPISFAVPQCKIAKQVKNKKLHTAYIYPGKQETYIYKDQFSYYEGYRNAFFGVTFKKGGWDCLRHYQIMMNGCIPYFIDIDKCPTYIMHNFPKTIVQYTNSLYNKNVSNDQLLYYCNYFLNYTKNYLTTKQLAKYVLSKLF